MKSPIFSENHKTYLWIVEINNCQAFKFCTNFVRRCFDFHLLHEVGAADACIFPSMSKTDRQANGQTDRDVCNRKFLASFQDSGKKTGKLRVALLALLLRLLGYISQKN